MVIVYDKIGQMSNRIWSAVPSIAHCLEHNEKLIFVYFGEYISHFPHINEHPLIRFYGIRGKWSIIFKMISKLSKLGIIPHNFRDLNSKTAIKFIQGWRSRHMVDSQLITKHKAIICNLFRYSDAVVEDVNAQFAKKRLLSDMLVGVHIRRGDYKDWINGNYYYSDELYAKWIHAVNEKIVQQGKTLSFFIASNERIDVKNFANNDCFVLQNSSAEKDVYGLSQCDYIMGPPSTYSQWAAFIGDIPIRFLLSKNDIPFLDGFLKVQSLFYFENGQSMILEPDGFKYVDGLQYNYNKV